MRTFFIPLWLCACVAVQAAGNTSAPMNVAVERARIIEHRALLEADFVKVQQGCYARFAVSDCLRQARRERRAMLDGLRRQEVVLNDLDRQAKAAAQLDRIGGKLSTERQEELEMQRQQALENTQQRQLRSDEKKTTLARPAAGVSSSARSLQPMARPDDSLARQQRYADKLEQARQRKEEKTRNLREKGASNARPLPTPADQ